VVDEANDDDAAAGARASRIATSVQALALDGALAGQAVGALADSAAAEGPSAGAGSSAPAQAPAPQQHRQEQEQKPKQERPLGAANGAAPSDDSDSDDESAAGGNDGWEMASKSQGAARRRRRKEQRRQQRQAEFEEEWQEHSQLMQEQREQQGQQQGAAPMEGDSGEGGEEAGAEQVEPEQLYGPAGVFAADEEEEEEEEEGEEEDEGDEDEGEEEEGEDGGPGQHQDEGEEGEQEQEQQQERAGAAGSAAAASAAADHATTAAWDAPPGGASSSSVATMTADFAMQNVLLQMGLRLLSRDGRVVTKLSRWALRCSACFFVTREAGRLFCPKCGNMSLDKVEVTVGPDGSEYFGVRKRHILRGTKFSLPKPKVGPRWRRGWLGGWPVWSCAWVCACLSDFRPPCLPLNSASAPPPSKPLALNLQTPTPNVTFRAAATGPTPS
jgi:RNA-binding protein NOB1